MWSLHRWARFVLRHLVSPASIRHAEGLAATPKISRRFLVQDKVSAATTFCSIKAYQTCGVKNSRCTFGVASCGWDWEPNTPLSILLLLPVVNK
jgi:hypothetical protein